MKKTLICVISVLLLSISPVEAQENKGIATEKSLLEKYVFKKDMPAAVNVDLHLRTSFNVNTLPGADGKSTSVGFRTDHVMLGIYGDVTPKFSYKFLQRLNKCGETLSLENLSNTIDYAYVDYRFRPNAFVRAGRHALFFGGFEYNEYPIDVYDYSGITNYISCYLTGVSLSYRPVASQELGVQLMNNRAGTSEQAYGRIPEGLEDAAVPLYYSVAWNGDFLDGKLSFRYAATAGEQLRGKWVFMLGGGQRIALGKFSLYLDALYHRADIDHLGVVRGMGSLPDGKAWEGIARNVEYLSVVSEANWRVHPKWNIRVKGFYDRAGVYRSNGIFAEGCYLSAWTGQGGIEFYPMKDNNMHLFLNATGKKYLDVVNKQAVVPDDAFRLSLGFVYRLPVL